jgi:uncharacterized protein with HEPN domain
MPLRERDAALFADMLTSCREAWEFCRGVEFEQFISDRKLCLAVERCLEIVGEAASRISEDARAAHPEIPWQRIKGLRNVLAHDYGNTEYETLFKSAREDVPVLRASLEAILTGARGVREAAPLYRVAREPGSRRTVGIPAFAG